MLGLRLMASLFKSYVTVEHSLNSTGIHRMGDKLLERLKMEKKTLGTKTRFIAFFGEEVLRYGPQMCVVCEFPSNSEFIVFCFSKIVRDFVFRKIEISFFSLLTCVMST